MSGWGYYGTQPLDPDPMFSVLWSARRLADTVDFTVRLTMLRDFLAPEEGEPSAPFPAKVVFGAIAITADGNFPHPPPTRTTANEGLVLSPRIVGGSGVTLTRAFTGGLFTPIINGGTVGIAEGASITVAGSAPAKLDIAYAQIGFLNEFDYGIGDVSIAWVNTDCDIDDILYSTPGWTISDPSYTTGWTIWSPRTR